MAKEDLTSIIDLAERLGIRKQSIFKILDRLEIQPQKHRDVSKKNQFTSFVTSVEAEKISRECEKIALRSGPVEGELETDETDLGSTTVGVFYLIQLEPDHDPGRFKVGFTSDLDGRLQKHRCSAPFAIVAKTWPCRRTWERAAIDCATVEAEQLHTEVFRLEAIAMAIARADGFFNVMPAVNAGAGDESESGVD